MSSSHVQPVTHEATSFVEVSRCPLCDGEADSLHYAGRFESESVRTFIRTYYDGRVPESHLVGAFEVARCDGCDFWWHKQRLRDDLLNVFYDQWIDPKPSLEKQERKVPAVRLQELRVIRRTLRGANPVGRPRMLDFGGGWGDRAYAARGIGVDAALLEGSAVRRAHASARGVPTYESLDELPDKPFDLIMLNQVLEHVPEPLALLVALRPHVRPGGCIFVGVPHARASAPVLSKGPFQPLEHINGFSPRALQAAFVRSGYQPIADYDVAVDLRLRSVASVLKRNMSIFLRHSLRRPPGTTALLARRPPWT